MAASTAADALANWQKGMQGAGATWLKGIQSTSKDPTALASTAQALSKYAANTAAASAPGGRMAQGLQRAGKAGWQAACQLAQAKVAMGAAKGASKYQAWAQGKGQAAWAAAAAAADQARQSGADPETIWRAAYDVMRTQARH
jgi:hypothetical protein